MKENSVIKRKQENLDRLYDMIVTAYEERRFPPTVREICKALGLASTSSAYHYLRELEEKGKIILVHGVTRGIMLPPVAV